MKTLLSTVVGLSACVALVAVGCSGDDHAGASGSGGSDSGTGGDPGSAGLGGDTATGGQIGTAGMAGAGTGGDGNPLPTSCDGVVCNALATCDDSSGVAKCVCADGFEGQQCDDVDECSTK